MDIGAPNPGDRLDAAFDPARLERARAAGEAERPMPWQRPGVVVEDDRTIFGPRGPFKVRTLVLFALLGVLPLMVLPFVMMPRGFRSAALIGPFVLFGALLGVMLWSNWLVGRAKRTGEPYAPLWCGWALVGAVLAMLGAAVLGLLPVRHIGFVLMMSMGVSAGLLFPMRKRRGFDLHCAKCDYAYTYTDPEGAPAPEVCSECGAAWHDKGGLVRGAKVRVSPVRLAIYILLVAGMFSSIMFRRPAMRIVPTGTLISMVTAPRAGFTMDEWAELSTRPLDQRQRERLARGLIDLRLAEQSLAREADVWLDAEALAGRLPAEIVERYHREMFAATLLMPEAARAGEAVEVGLDASQRGYPGGPREVLLAVEGFERLDKPGEWAGRQDLLIHGNMAGLRNVWLGNASGSDYAPRAEFVFGEPGRHRVRCVYWVMVVPRFTQTAPVAWDENGPSVPSGAYFVERREVVGEVEVVPAAP